MFPYFFIELKPYLGGITWFQVLYWLSGKLTLICDFPHISIIVLENLFGPLVFIHYGMEVQVCEDVVVYCIIPLYFVIIVCLMEIYMKYQLLQSFLFGWFVTKWY